MTEKQLDGWEERNFFRKARRGAAGGSDVDLRRLELIERLPHEDPDFPISQEMISRIVKNSVDLYPERNRRGLQNRDIGFLTKAFQEADWDKQDIQTTQQKRIKAGGPRATEALIKDTLRDRVQEIIVASQEAYNETRRATLLSGTTAVLGQAISTLYRQRGTVTKDMVLECTKYRGWSSHDDRPPHAIEEARNILGDLAEEVIEEILKREKNWTLQERALRNAPALD